MPTGPGGTRVAPTRLADGARPGALSVVPKSNTESEAVSSSVASTNRPCGSITSSIVPEPAPRMRSRTASFAPERMPSVLRTSNPPELSATIRWRPSVVTAIPRGTAPSVSHSGSPGVHGSWSVAGPLVLSATSPRWPSRGIET